MLIRIVLALAAMLAGTVAVQAADSVRYENARYGFGVDVPDELHALPATTNTGDQVFASIDGTQVLTVGGGSVLPGSFNAAWERTQDAYAQQGWTISYEPKPPNWTSFAGVRGDRALFVKMLPLCGGTKEFARIAFEYPAAQAEAMEPVALVIAASMTRSGTGFSC
jgi:hypothetical protein